MSGVSAGPEATSAESSGEPTFRGVLKDFWNWFKGNWPFFVMLLAVSWLLSTFDASHDYRILIGMAVVALLLTAIGIIAALRARSWRWAVSTGVLGCGTAAFTLLYPWGRHSTAYLLAAFAYLVIWFFGGHLLEKGKRELGESGTQESEAYRKLAGRQDPAATTAWAAPPSSERERFEDRLARIGLLATVSFLLLCALAWMKWAFFG